MTAPRQRRHCRELPSPADPRHPLVVRLERAERQARHAELDDVARDLQEALDALEALAERAAAALEHAGVPETGAPLCRFCRQLPRGPREACPGRGQDATGALPDCEPAEHPSTATLLELRRISRSGWGRS